MKTLENKTQGGIWRYAAFYPLFVPKKKQISLGEGNTPLLEVPLSKICQSSLWIKREDFNPQGSHKDRALAFQVSYYGSQGYKRLAISSSGNGAISLSAYAQEAGIEALVFVHPQTPPYKLDRILSFQPHIIITEKAINFGRYVERRYGIPNLRPSTNEIAPIGYYSLALEIYESQVPMDSIFLFTTSGATLIGLYEAFWKLKRDGKIKKLPAFHAVQAGGITSIASAFEKNLEVEEEKEDVKVPGFLGGPKTPRKEAVLEALKTTGGRGWYLKSSEIEEGSKSLEDMGLHTSLEGVSAFQCAIKALQIGIVERPLVIFTGKKEEEKQEGSIKDLP
ncbi:MAG: pyridoxal-phosphate dependent enzyme, partial [Planctomycetota bacterium]